MLNKRIIGVVTVRGGWAVQSFGYKSYLPLGKPEVLVENLDRWGADEILVNVIDRSSKKLGPDFNLIGKIADLGVSTPIIYGGGIRNENDGINVVQRGADRISINNMLFESQDSVCKISDNLGSQAIIASLPLSFIDGQLQHYNYITRKSVDISSEIIALFRTKIVSELMISDWMNEGSLDRFNIDLIKSRELIGSKLIAFGGAGDPRVGKKIMEYNNVSAVAIGNPFSYKEHAIQNYSNQLNADFLRPPYFRDELTYDWNQ